MFGMCLFTNVDQSKTKNTNVAQQFALQQHYFKKNQNFIILTKNRNKNHSFPQTSTKTKLPKQINNKLRQWRKKKTTGMDEEQNYRTDKQYTSERRWRTKK